MSGLQPEQSAASRNSEMRTVSTTARTKKKGSTLAPSVFAPNDEEEEEASFSRTSWKTISGRHIWIVDDFRNLLSRADEKTVRETRRRRKRKRGDPPNT